MGLRQILAANRAYQQLPPLAPGLSSDLAWGSPFADSGALDHLWWDADLPAFSTLPMSRAQAMTLAPVAKIRHTLSGSIGRFPLVAMTGSEPTARQPWITKQPEIGRPRVTTITWTVDALLFWGRAWFLAAERDTDGRPRRLQWVPEWNADTDADGRLVSAFGKSVNQADVYRIDGPHEGLLNFGNQTLREAMETDRAARNASANPVPSIELHQTGGEPMTKTQIDELTARWNAARSRPGGGVAYTNQSIETKTHGQAAEQLLIDARNTAALNIARAAGMPAWSVDANVPGSSLNYSNAPSRSRELIDYGLTPYMNAIESRLSMDDILPAGQWCRFDTTDLLRGDFAARMAAYKDAIEAGIFTAEQCAAMEKGTALEESSATA